MAESSHPTAPVIAERDQFRGGSRKGRRLAPLLLRDLRHVYTRPEGEDRTTGQRVLRQLLRDEPAKFLDRLSKEEANHEARLEEAAAAAEGSVAGGGVPADPYCGDEGARKVGALLDQLIADFEAGKRP